MKQTTGAYTLTTPYAQLKGRTRIHVERDALELARLHVQLGESHLSLSLAGAHIRELIGCLESVLELEAELRDEVAS